MPSPVAELYKDKIEVSLDGRQIFYLFFGGSVIVGMVFVLGVMVGRRVEARGHLDRAQTSATSDPLAALDRLDSGKPLSFQGALTGSTAPTEVDGRIEQLGQARAAAAAAAALPAVKKADAKQDDAKKADAKQADAKQADAKQADAKKADAKQADAKRSGDAQAKPGRDQKPEAAAKSDAKDSKQDAPKSSYTLQLSSFQDKSEADQFLRALKSSGYSPTMTVAEVEGKGTFYRVRMGKYASLDAASDAKSTYERASSKTASIMKL